MDNKRKIRQIGIGFDTVCVEETPEVLDRLDKLITNLIAQIKMAEQKAANQLSVSVSGWLRVDELTQQLRESEARINKLEEEIVSLHSIVSQTGWYC